MLKLKKSSDRSPYLAQLIVGMIVMKKNFYIFYIIGLFVLNAHCYATEKLCYSKMSEVLGCFIQHNDGAYRYEFVSESKGNPNITNRFYFVKKDAVIIYL